MSRPRRTWAQRAVLALNLALIVVCLGLAAAFSSSYDRAAAINRYQLSGALTPLEDERGDRVLNILLVGSDSSAGLDPDDPVQVGRAGERNGDVIIVAHLDERSDTAALLSFPRDLWVPIAGSGSRQKINAAFGVGGAETLIDTIEERFEIPIHHYVQVDFAGFRSLVEAVGPVPVWFDAPARDWNPAQGASHTGFAVREAGCIELGPEQALAYVRSRYYQTQGPDGRWVTDPRSDLGRIARQQDFLRRLLTKAVDEGARNPFTLRELIDVALDRVTIDQQLTPQDLLDLGRRFSAFDPAQLRTYTVPVELGTVGTASVLFAQDEALEPILALFRGAEVDDPATVRVRVEHAPARRAEAADVADRLVELGYPVAGTATADVPAGTVVRHAPDAVAAARRLADAVDPVAQLVADPALAGRDVVVAIGPDPSTVDGGSAPAGDGDAGGAAPGRPPAVSPDPATALDPAAACR